MNLPRTTLSAFEGRIGYRFSNRRLLEEALTHRSYLNESTGEVVSDNERLEFLGDAVLSLYVASRLFREFPGRREGDLSKMRAALVDEATLARSAGELGLGDLLRLGRGEEASGGRSRKSILADAFEALIGALYLDGGDAAVAPLLESHYVLLSPSLETGFRRRDSKSEFQELAQSLVSITPHYRITATSGPDHARIFTVAAFLGNELIGEGSGRSKKEAEQEAARRGIEKLGGRNGTQDEQ